MRLFSRNGNDWSRRYPWIVEAALKKKHSYGDMYHHFTKPFSKPSRVSCFFHGASVASCVGSGALMNMLPGRAARLGGFLYHLVVLSLETH